MKLETLAKQWLMAKEQERTAIEERRKIDRAIAEMMEKKQEGTVSIGIGDYKAAVTYKMERKVNTDALRKAWQAIPEAAQSAIKWKAEVSVSALRLLSDDERASLSDYITTKPATPTVTVETI